MKFDSINKEATKLLLSSKNMQKVESRSGDFLPSVVKAWTGIEILEKIFGYKKRRFFDWEHLDYTSRHFNFNTLLDRPKIKHIQNLKLSKKQ